MTFAATIISKVPFAVKAVRQLLLSTSTFAMACTSFGAGATGTAPATRVSEEQAIELATLEIVEHPTGADERTAAVWVQRPSAEDTSPRLADLLNQVPGMHLNQAGGAGGKCTLHLRGGEENHTLVLLDGVPLNDPTNSRGGGVDFSLIDPSALDSVAVVRGPGSMRHGPDAISGVIHLDTATAAISDTRIAFEAGGDGLVRAALRGRAAPRQDTSVSVGATRHEEDAVDQAGSLRRTFLHGSYQQKNVIHFGINAWYLDQDSSGFPDDSGGVHHAVIRELEHRTDRQTAASMHLGRRDDEGSWMVTADAARLDARTVSPGVAPGTRDPAGLPASIDDIRFDRLRVAVIAERRVARWTISGGLDAAREDGRDEALLDFGFFQLPASFRMQRNRIGGFVEGVGPITERITFSGGLRGDTFDDVGTHATGRAGLLGSIGDNTEWRLNAGSGFKAPSFFGLAHPLVGNPDLKPERGRSLDFGLRRTFARGRGLIDFTVFTSELRNGVDFDPGPPPRIANVAEIRSRGVEAAALWRLTDFIRVSGSLGYTDATSEPDGARMRSRPRWNGTTEITWNPTPAWTLVARATGVDGVPDSSIPTGDVILPGWVRTDLAVLWAMDRHWSATAACDNLLNRYHEEIVGFTAPGRRLRIGVQFVF